jgi:hypothetical protein
MDGRYVRVVLRFDEREYACDDPFPMTDADEAKVAETALYQYTEGNYSCDCNRSLFIGRYCEDAPDAWPGEDEDGAMPCGDRFELVSLVFVGGDGHERVLWPEPDDAPGRVIDRLVALGMVPAGMS